MQKYMPAILVDKRMFCLPEQGRFRALDVFRVEHVNRERFLVFVFASGGRVCQVAHGFCSVMLAWLAVTVGVSSPWPLAGPLAGPLAWPLAAVLADRI